MSRNTTIIRAVAGDTVDLICWQLYGEKMLQSQVVEQVLELNHGLADLGEVLPMGTLITIPMLPPIAARKETVQLWT